jgi:Tol biopolymer transport system component
MVRMPRVKPFHRLVGLSAALVYFGLATACNGVAGGEPSPCEWSISNTRPAQAEDVSYEKLHPLLRDPANPNNVPGPGTLRAVVKSDSLHHPHIYIEDTATDTRRLLRRGSRPRWSPNGKQIAATVWESIDRPWLLCIVDVATGKSFVPELGCLVMNYEWSPNGNTIAIGGVMYGQARNVLCLYSVASRSSRIVDTLQVFSDYQFGWSPDSRHLIVQRPSRVVGEQEPSAADLWLFDLRGGKCQLTQTAEYVESEPRWIDNRRALTTRRLVTGQDAQSEVVHVLELAHSRASGGTP